MFRGLPPPTEASQRVCPSASPFIGVQGDRRNLLRMDPSFLKPLKRRFSHIFGLICPGGTKKNESISGFSLKSPDWRVHQAFSLTRCWGGGHEGTGRGLNTLS